MMAPMKKNYLLLILLILLINATAIISLPADESFVVELSMLRGDNMPDMVWPAMIIAPEQQSRIEWVMRGVFKGKTIHLVDGNNDRRIDVSGADAIAIENQYLMRLKNQISIDGEFYNVSFSPDGRELLLARIEHANLAKVDLKAGLRNWQMFVLMNDSGVFNIAADNCGILPAGKYNIDYGIYGTGTETLALLTIDKLNPGLADREIEIAPDQVNIINIGPPFKLYFKANLQGNRVRVMPAIDIVGCFGEVYYQNPHWWPANKNQPEIIGFEGRKIVFSGKMEFG